MDLYLAAIRYSKPDSTENHRTPPTAAEEDAYYAQFGQPIFDPWVGRVVTFIGALLTQPRQPVVEAPRRSVRHA